jgi:hypothetical protein
VLGRQPCGTAPAEPVEDGGCSPLFDSQRCCDCLAQLMLPMEEVRRVMRSEVLFNICQQVWSLIAGRWDHPTVEP